MIDVCILLLDLAKDLVDLVDYIGIAVEMHEGGEKRLYAVGNEIFRAADELSRIDSVLILGVVHYTLGYENYVTRDQVIDLVFDEITSFALGNKIYLEM